MSKYLRQKGIGASDTLIGVLASREDQLRSNLKHIRVNDASVNSTGTSSVRVSFKDVPDIETDETYFLRDVSIHFFGSQYPDYVDKCCTDGMKYSLLDHLSFVEEELKKARRKFFLKQKSEDQKELISAKRKETFLKSLGDRFAKSSQDFILTEEEVVQCFQDNYVVRRVLEG